MAYRILKDSSTFGEGFDIYSGYGGLQALINGPFGYTYSETSGSTSSRTYKVQVKNPETQTGSTYNQYEWLFSLRSLRNRGNNGTFRKNK